MKEEDFQEENVVGRPEGGLFGFGGG